MVQESGYRYGSDPVPEIDARAVLIATGATEPSSSAWTL